MKEGASEFRRRMLAEARKDRNDFSSNADWKQDSGGGKLGKNQEECGEMGGNR
jgi:hypothetical protein